MNVIVNVPTPGQSVNHTALAGISLTPDMHLCTDMSFFKVCLSCLNYDPQTGEQQKTALCYCIILATPEEENMLILLRSNTRGESVIIEGGEERQWCNVEEKDLAYIENKSYKVAVKYDQ